MKITTRQLRRIIYEEIQRDIEEENSSSSLSETMDSIKRFIFEDFGLFV